MLEIECETDLSGFVIYHYNNLHKELRGISAMMYTWMVNVLGKEEADQEFFAMMYKKDGAHSPIVPSSLSIPHKDHNMLSKKGLYHD